MAELRSIKPYTISDGGDHYPSGKVNKAYIKSPDEKIHDEKSEKKQASSSKKNMSKSGILSGLRYKVDDNPPWIASILLGFQHYLMLLSSNLATPGIMASIICAIGISDEMHVKSVLMGNMIFACGVCTLVQTFLGARLPIVQCPAFAYIVPMLALTKIGRWKCPAVNEDGASANSTMEPTTTTMPTNYPDYTERMNDLTGSIMVAAALEIIIGFSGLVSVLLRFIGPLTVAPTIMLMGLSVAETGFELAGKHWGISIGTIVLIILLSEVIPIFHVTNPFSKKGEKMEIVAHKLFSVCSILSSDISLETPIQDASNDMSNDIFGLKWIRYVPSSRIRVILSTCIMWLICYILTAAGALPSEEGKYGYEARTDIRLDVIDEVAWVRFPYPGYWGKPTFNSGFFVAMVAGVITSVIESIGDYYTCARMAGALPPPEHAVNRGIFVEGIDCIISSAVGAGFGVTSCSQNIGVISLTKVGSRRVVLIAGLIMTIFGCLGKFSALVVSMPDPIIGASFLVLFGVLAAVGASNLQYVDLNSSRNLVVFGISLFLGLSFPGWVVNNSDLIATGNDSLDQVINALLANNMFMGCFSALVLDNVIPGSDEERGILTWREVPEGSDDDDSLDDDDNNMTMKTYNMPFGMDFIRRSNILRYFPISPTFKGLNDMNCGCCPGNDIDDYKGEEAQVVMTDSDDQDSFRNKKVRNGLSSV